MPEVPRTGEHHGEPQPIRGLDYILIPYRSSGLHHGHSAGSRRFFHPIRKGEKRVRGNHRSFQRVLQLTRFGGA
jgi:hypothetical protein